MNISSSICIFLWCSFDFSSLASENIAHGLLLLSAEKKLKRSMQSLLELMARAQLTNHWKIVTKWPTHYAANGQSSMSYCSYSYPRSFSKTNTAIVSLLITNTNHQDLSSGGSGEIPGFVLEKNTFPYSHPFLFPHSLSPFFSACSEMPSSSS